MFNDYDFQLNFLLFINSYVSLISSIEDGEG